ncbi:MAG: MBL fold metallo-hydrolase [Candidatus Njordarchaeales archaeon]
MKIKILGADSLGVRSMATYIETKDARILIDPGANLAPKRSGLPPHPLEVDRLNGVWREIRNYAMRADILIISHYHLDHYHPEREIEIYEGKVVFLKHPTLNINTNQMQRANIFLSKIREMADIIEFADDREFFFNETRILFSKPVPHGINKNLGYVLEILIDDGEKRFLFTSDTQGLPTKEHIEFILRTKPNIIFLDGPPTYLLGSRYEEKHLKSSLERLPEIISKCPIEKLIIDHHFLRDLNWTQYLIKNNLHRYLLEKKIITAAEFLNKEPDLLEARRKELWHREQH